MTPYWALGPLFERLPRWRREMWKKSTPAILLSALVTILLPNADAWAIPHSVRVFDTQKQFVNVTKAGNVPIPSSQTAFPGTTCGLPLSGPVTGIGSSTTMSFDSNAVTVIQTGGGSALCIFDKGFTDPVPNETNPSLMIANTILANGEDDYFLTFARPVDAVGFDLLTNVVAKEQVTLRDEAGDVISTENIDSLTEPNTRQFVGFQSKGADIKSLLLDTTFGAVQNEGFDELWVASDPPDAVPEPATLLLWGTTMAGLGLARWKRRSQQ